MRSARPPKGLRTFALKLPAAQRSRRPHHLDLVDFWKTTPGFWPQLALRNAMMIALQQAGLTDVPRIGEGLFEALEGAGLPPDLAFVLEFGFEQALPFSDDLATRLAPRMDTARIIGRFPIHAGAQMVLDESADGRALGVWVDPRGAPFLVLSLLAGPARGAVRTLCLAHQQFKTQSPPSAFVLLHDEVVGVACLLHDRLVFTNRLSLDTAIANIQEIPEAQFDALKKTLAKIAGPLVKRLSALPEPGLPGSIWEVAGREPPPADPVGSPPPSGPPLRWEPGRSAEGASPDQPILCHDPSGERAHLARLRCPNGEPYSFTRQGSVMGKCPRPETHRQSIVDPRAGRVNVDLYELTCACGQHRGELYFDMYHPEVEQERPQAPADVSPNGARRIYRILCNLAACDGFIDPSERRVLDETLERFRIPSSEAEALEAEGTRGKGLRVGKNPAEREFLMNAMIEVAAADGVLAPEERRRLLKFGDAVGLSRRALEELLGRMFPDGA